MSDWESDMEDPKRQDPQPREQQTKRAYRSPKLTEYGSATKLTKGTRTVALDGSAGRYKRTCL